MENSELAGTETDQRASFSGKCNVREDTNLLPFLTLPTRSLGGRQLSAKAWTLRHTYTPEFQTLSASSETGGEGERVVPKFNVKISQVPTGAPFSKQRVILTP